MKRPRQSEGARPASGGSGRTGVAAPTGIASPREWHPQAEDQIVSASPRAEPILVPHEARGKPLAAFPVSARLQHMFDFQGFRLLGDLHGRTFSEIGAYRNCGQKTLGELRKLIATIQLAHRSTPIVAGAFFLPAPLHDLSPSDLPLSAQLARLLTGKRVRRLGELHGVPLSEWMAHDLRARTTIGEVLRLIERAAAGELQPAAEVVWDPAEMVRTLDALVADLPDRDRAMLVLRLGGMSEVVSTLKDAAARFHVSRESVRLIVNRTVEDLRRAGHRRLRSYLGRLEAICEAKVCPLTPALLSQWLELSPVAARFRPAFYVRLLGRLSPAVPAWPGTQSSRASRRGRSELIERGLEAVLREQAGSLPLSEVLPRLRAQAGLRKVASVEFLATLQLSPRFVVEFPKPDVPVVRLAGGLAPSAARARRV